MAPLAPRGYAYTCITTRKYIWDEIQMHNGELAKNTKFHL